ncbi:MAG: acetyl-CoA carboxylase biotin carboxyl carrier protein [Planctomycetota bacterium]|nr:acetyl-CoA carboxylase biotin carboxyl carrier protein [Planctomycetota bacterium]MDA1106582.1 acetyl-CoA carboxylase biotin carboxyl carrier protein [Planctomycetota bacterium]
MIDIRKLKELVKLMVENDLCEMDLRDADETVSLKRPGQAPPLVMHAPAGGAPTIVQLPSAGYAPATAATAPTANLPAIESPMVGTMYSAPGPGKPNFVSAGSRVSLDTTVCLIEAMKIFNEIKAEKVGTIVEVLVENGKAVEFGQRLFTIQPD